MGDIILANAMQKKIKPYLVIHALFRYVDRIYGSHLLLDNYFELINRHYHTYFAYFFTFVANSD
jgi:hypothetical protein